jgi:5-methylcytosine-specific restriction endonuclease McrA
VGNLTAERLRAEMSVRCSGDGNPSKSPTVARKISISLSAYIRANGARSGEKNPFFGKAHSDAFKKQRSEERKGKRSYNDEQFTKLLERTPKGADHPLWNGGVSFEPYPLKWTKQLKERIRSLYNHKCVLCGTTPKIALSVHHVDYAKENLNESNLVPLCPSCHGKTNVKRGQWSAYFSAFVSHGCRDHQCSKCTLMRPV